VKVVGRACSQVGHHHVAVSLVTGGECHSKMNDQPGVGLRRRGYVRAVLAFPQDPMLARHVAALPTTGALRGGCVYEPKFDGYRALLFVTDEGCRVQSRRGHDITDAFQDVADAAAQRLPEGLVLDGELVVWVDGGLDFGELQRRVGHGRNRRLKQRPASFVAFDVLAAGGNDVRSAALTVRPASGWLPIWPPTWASRVSS
jgi:ATP-dependent DNA ligase